MAIFLLTLFFIVFTILGMPVAFAIGLSSLAALLSMGIPLVVIPHSMFGGVDSFTICAIPMFILAGEIMLQGTLTRSLTDLSDILVGRLRGGLGQVNITTSIFFAGITGSATADTTAVGSLLIPAMKDRGYDASYATAVTIASSVIGPIIPPSLTFIVYALAVGNISIGGLFLAGIVPGLLTGLALMILHHRISAKRNYEKRTTAYNKKAIFAILRKSIVVMVMPILIIGGVLSGAFTPTESAAVASLYALIISLFVFRTLTFADIPKIFFNTAKVNAIIILLLGTSTAFSYVLSIENVPAKIALLLTSFSDSKIVFLVILNLLLLIIGCVVDTFPAIIIFAPIFAPVAAKFGVHPLQFGVVFCVNLLIGLNTPPVGTGLFVGSIVGKVKLESLIREVLPFTLVQWIVLLVITYIPVVTLWIPVYFGY